MLKIKGLILLFLTFIIFKDIKKDFKIYYCIITATAPATLAAATLAALTPDY